MAFRDFGFPEVQHKLGLTLAEIDLFGAVPPLDLPAEFTARMPKGHRPGAWKFLQLTKAALTLDARVYFVAELGRIMGILANILQNA